MSDFNDISSSSSSAVWKYFLKNKFQQTAKCKECKTKTTILSSKGGTTSARKDIENMLLHLWQRLFLNFELSASSENTDNTSNKVRISFALKVGILIT